MRSGTVGYGGGARSATPSGWVATCRVPVAAQGGGENATIATALACGTRSRKRDRRAITPLTVPKIRTLGAALTFVFLDLLLMSHRSICLRLFCLIFDGYGYWIDVEVDR